MAGIYIHIPFCKQQCTYCDFHFSTTFSEYRPKMISAIAKELESRKGYLHGAKVNSIYFGGGTPSILTENEILSLINIVKTTFHVNESAEITLEANPDDITKESLQQWKNVGINRLSIGIQSFKESDLKWMNRAHNAFEAESCVQLAKSVGFDNLTVDLIYGLPNLSNQEWEQHILKVIAMDVTHISAYCLTVEEKTVLSSPVKKGTIIPANEETQSDQFLILLKVLAEHGFEQYEVSNFCKPNHEAVHNSNYWKSEPYLGVGPSAHSFNLISRSWNIKNNQEYIKAIDKNLSYSETEILSKEDQFNELLLTGLRTKFGVSIQALEKCVEIKKSFWTQIDELKNQKLLVQDQEILKLTKLGMLQADRIASDLFQIKH